MALSANTKYDFEFNSDPEYDDIPVNATSQLYEGSIVGEDVATGAGRALVAGDTFMGISVHDVLGGAADGDERVRVRTRGKVALPITGVTGIGDYDSPVYASDDGTFTLTAGGNTQIGKVARYVTGTTCIVRFESSSVQSI